MDRLADLKSDDPAVNTDDPDMGGTNSHGPGARDLELGAAGGNSGGGAAGTGSFPGGDVIAEQTALVEPIKIATNKVKSHTVTAQKLLEKQMKTASAEEKADIQNKMTAILNDTKITGMGVKKLVTELQEANRKFAEENVGSSTAQIRINILTKHINDYQTAIRAFEMANDSWKQTMQNTTRRELRNVGLDEKKIDAVIQSGQAQAVLQASVSGDLTDIIDDIEARHASILALERSVREVQELFTDLAALVNQQQEHIDNIAKSIENTVDYVEKGKDNLETASKDQDTARKRQCCIVVIVIAVLFVVVGIPLLKTFV